MRSSASPGVVWKRKAAGAAWLVAWVLVLYLVASPWRDLGGLVDERLRWLEGFVLLAALSGGFTVGRFGRDAVRDGRVGTHLRFLRFLLYPPAALTAIALVALSFLKQRGAIGVVVSAFLAYWAGLDLAFGAVPLMEGRSYRLNGPLDPEPDPDREREGGGADRWVPPWERF